jgi:hypothetical protein
MSLPPTKSFCSTKVFSSGRRHLLGIIAPKPPGGDNSWTMTGMTATGGYLYFFWEREDKPSLPPNMFGDMVL